MGYQDGCPWRLYIAASNPIVGHNKVRVAYLRDPEGSGRGCYQIWDDMDAWYESEGNAHPVGESVYDNPSWIHYRLDIPSECEQTFKIRHVESGQHLTVVGREDGSPITLTGDQSSGHQLWKMRSNGQIYNAATGKCLDPDSNKQTSSMMAWDCWSDVHQGWTLDKMFDGLDGTFVRNKQSSLCIDPVGQMYSCGSTSHQSYRFILQNDRSMELLEAPSNITLI